MIQINNVSKKFGKLYAVNNISLNISEGNFIAFLGPNGAGKTTLLEMIEGIQKPTKGEITLFNKNWQQHYNELYNLIGLTLQETKFIDKLSVLEILLLFGSFYKVKKERCKEVLDMIHLTDKKHTYTEKLSGGQKQRLALGLSFLHNPKLILLDEPTTGLDPNARRDIWEILFNFKKQGATLLLTTHYMEEAEQLCDYIYMLHEGKILTEGSLKDLFYKHNQYYMLYCTTNKKIKTSLFKNNKNIVSIQSLKNNTILLSVKKLPLGIEELNKIIKKEKAYIIDIETSKPTLEKLFLHLTGVNLNHERYF